MLILLRCVVLSDLSGKVGPSAGARRFWFLVWLRFRWLMVWLSRYGCLRVCGSLCWW
nr:MAG TPA: hypothetical protein [Caudoviricetes sp.]